MDALPESLHRALASAVQRRYMDGDEAAAGWGDAFVEAEDGKGFVAAQPVEAYSRVFLIDHLWCTTYYHARQQLTDMPVIRRNMKYLLGIEEDSESSSSESEDDADQEEGEGEETALVPPNGEALLRRLELSASEAAGMEEVTLDGLSLLREEVEAYALPALFPACRALGLQDMGWGGGHVDSLCAVLQGFGALRAVWLNGNPLCRDEGAMARLRDVADTMGWEIFNRQLTPSYGLWALLHLSDATDPSDVRSLELRGRGIHVLKGEVFASLPNLERLDVRGNPLPLESSAASESDVVDVLRGLPRLCSLHIDVSSDLAATALAQALPRLSWLNGRRVGRSSGEGGVEFLDGGGRVGEGVERVMQGVWALVEPMRVATGEGQHPELYWYVMDTPGLGVGHSGTPNLRMAALREPRLGVTFSALWPIRDIQPGERLTRDFLDGFPPLPPSSQHLLLRGILGPRASLILGEAGPSASGPSDGSLPPLPPPPPPPPPPSSCLSTAEAQTAYNGTLTVTTTEDTDRVRYPKAPDGGPSASSSSGEPQGAHEKEGRSSAPSSSADAKGNGPMGMWRVYSDMPVLRQHLTHPRFTFVHTPDEADILWTAGHVPRLHPPQYVTSMPCLSAMDDKCTMANLLLEEGGPWDGLPLTFCLPQELAAFVAFVEAAPPTPWIVKPPHLARGWDIVVLSTAPGVLRHLQASDRLSVSAYVSDPDTHRGHKYDLRLYCLLIGTRKVLLHEHFRLRVARRPYTPHPTQLQDVHVHLTNTTLGSDGQPAETLSKQDFIEGFAQAHGGKPWGPVYDSIVNLLEETFRRLLASTAFRESEPQGRALVGVDVLLDSKLKPWLIEINASPNCLGLCVERPEFFNLVFQACFVNSDGDSEDLGFRILTER